ncbi:hypothetical protein [Tengunoibacter tsumagoiensis]|uniref:Uncharacterized protein n=1 Tax=Tengunoibacter tsumagoiensis TaxID=2014871 RepID=A0A401ZZJ6_9CHLR|nr:hypothetical protein [Tengunoibacter tsumagoiensis]GCE12288.1 hypothetical protein KTT_21470 [Tengunoibacter tsumagoiensis]
MDTSKQQAEQQRVQRLNDEAIAAGTTPERLQKQSQQKVHDLSSDNEHAHQLRDGYRETQGPDYEQENPGPEQEQESYNPSHSGVRQSHRQPGRPATAPGRDEGTAWSEKSQMGATDTPDHKNPAD